MMEIFQDNYIISLTFAPFFQLICYKIFGIYDEALKIAENISEKFGENIFILSNMADIYNDIKGIYNFII